MSWGNRLPRVCTWAQLYDRETDVNLFVFNTHWDHESQESRIKSAALLLQSIDQFTDVGDPVIVMGDFNAGEANPAFRKMVNNEDRPLADTFRKLHPSVKNVGTFNEFKGTTTGEKIDAILISPEFTVESAEIVRTNSERRYPSDHFPVTATVRFKGKRD
jgi:endonuclease/exonuclease/phosphatase family metal-dependent hydrolase